MTMLDGFALGFWVGVAVVVYGPRCYAAFLRCVDSYPLVPPKPALSTYMRQYRVAESDPIESDGLTADARRALLLEQAWAICDREGLNRALTPEESRDFERQVGLR